VRNFESGRSLLRMTGTCTLKGAALQIVKIEIPGWMPGGPTLADGKAEKI